MSSSKKGSDLEKGYDLRDGADSKNAESNHQQSRHEEAVSFASGAATVDGPRRPAAESCRSGLPLQVVKSEEELACEHALYHSAVSEAWQQRGVQLGERVRIHPDAKIECPEQLVLEDDVEIGPDVRIDAGAGVRIGARTIVAPGAMILSTSQRIPTSGLGRVSSYGCRDLEIDIAADCYIGPRSMLLPGANLEEGVIVEPGLVLKRRLTKFKLLMASDCSRVMVRCA